MSEGAAPSRTRLAPARPLSCRQVRGNCNREGPAQWVSTRAVTGTGLGVRWPSGCSHRRADGERDVPGESVASTEQPHGRTGGRQRVGRPELVEGSQGLDLWTGTWSITSGTGRYAGAHGVGAYPASSGPTTGWRCISRDSEPRSRAYPNPNARGEPAASRIATASGSSVEVERKSLARIEIRKDG